MEMYPNMSYNDYVFDMPKKQIMTFSKKALVAGLVLAGLTFSISWAHVQAQILDTVEETVDSVTDTVEDATSTLTGDDATSSAAQQLKERIQRIVTEKKEEIEETVTELTTKKRGFVGEIIRVSENTLTVQTRTTTEIVPLTTEIPIQDTDGETVDFEEIAVGDWVVILGIIADDTFQPRRVTISEDSLAPVQKTVNLGSITDLSARLLELRLRSDETLEEFVITSNTTFVDQVGTEVDPDDIETETQALVVGYIDEDDGLTATTIKLLITVETDTPSEVTPIELGN